MRSPHTNRPRSSLRHPFAAIALAAAVLSAGTASPAPPADSDEVIYQEPITVEGVRASPVRLDELEVLFQTTAPLPERGWRNLTTGLPNFRVAAGGAGSYGDSFSLRGLANTPYFGDPAVTVYLGDLALGSSFTYPASLASFTRATVARGPQGTRVGRAGIAGVVTLESAEPGEQPAVELRAGAGEFGARTVALDAMTSRGSTADASLSLWREEHDGFIENTLLGINVDHRRATGGTARVRLRPAGTVELGLQLYAQRTNAGAQPLVPLGGPLFEVGRSREGSTGIDSAGAAFSAEFDLGGARVKAVTNYSTWELAPYDSHIVLPPAIDSRIDQRQNIWSEEIRISSQKAAPFRWSGGVPLPGQRPRAQRLPRCRARLPMKTLAPSKAPLMAP
jgi:outer membrane receptor protein involved in Fe transport